MSKYAIRFDPESSMTKQSFKDECDINKIMARFQKTGALTHYASNAPHYGDATDVQLADAMNLVANAENMFAELPSSIRKRFKNDPGRFLNFVQDPKNLEEMQKLGLAGSSKPIPVKKPTASKTINEHAPASGEQEKTEQSKASNQEN